jgi:3',5'-cyclic AMP phosphodiesterase CpdA
MKTLVLVAALFLVSPCHAQDALWFIQMSDPQFGMYTSDRDFAQETTNFEFAIATANRLRPNFVVISGDLVNKSGDARQIAEFERIARKLDRGIALYTVAGNHDVGNTPTRDSLAAFRRNIGKDYYSFEYPGFLGIVLDSSLIQHPEQAEEDAAQQRKWLEAQLANSSGASRIVIFQHIPFFMKSGDEADDYFNIPNTVRAEYLQLLNRFGVQYVFAGHLHHNSSGEAGSLHMISTGPVGKPLGDGASGMRIVKIDSTGVRERYFDFGHLPNSFDEVFAGKSN